MRCPRCHIESLMGAEYCIRCGASLFASGEPGGRLNAAEDGLPQIRRQMKEMGLRLSVVEGRVMVISERMGLAASEAPSDSDRHQAAGAESSPKAVGEWFPTELLNAPKAAPDGRVAPAAEGKPPATDMKAITQAAAPAAAEHVAPKEERATAPAEVRPAAPPSATEHAAPVVPGPVAPAKGPPKPKQPSRAAAKMREWEQALPGNWLSRIGMLALFIGLGFLRRSKENGLLAAFAFGIAIVFLTVAIPVQLEKSWITAA